MIETMAMGGAENLTVNVANMLADRGHESHLIVMAGPGPLSERIQGNVHVHYLEFHRSSIRNPIAFLSSLWRGHRRLRRLVASLGIDIVQTHLPGANFWGLSLALSKTCAAVPTVHNNEEFQYGAVDLPALVSLRKFAYRQMLRSCHGMVAVSEAVRASLIANLGLADSAATSISVVTNAVPMPEEISADQRQAVRERFGLKAGEVFVLSAGRFCDQKNFSDLVPVVKQLAERKARFRLIAAGDGELRTELQHRISEENLAAYVVTPGNVYDLSHVMLAADIFVMTSLWEGLPLVLLEAMATSLPAVAYGIDGINEVVEEGVTGLTSPAGSPEALADQLGVLIENPDRRQEMGAAAKQKISSSYSFDVLVDELVCIYETALTSLERSRR